MVNKIILVGRLTADAEFKQAKNGTSILTALICTTERFKNEEGKYTDHPEFHRLTAFGAKFEGVGKYLVKGTMIYAEGKLRHRSFVDKNNVKQYVTDIVIDEITLLGKSQKAETEALVMSETPIVEKKFDEDIPF